MEKLTEACLCLKIHVEKISKEINQIVAAITNTVRLANLSSDITDDFANRYFLFYLLQALFSLMSHKEKRDQVLVLCRVVTPTTIRLDETLKAQLLTFNINPDGRSDMHFQDAIDILAHMYHTDKTVRDEICIILDFYSKLICPTTTHGINYYTSNKDIILSTLFGDPLKKDNDKKEHNDKVITEIKAMQMTNIESRLSRLEDIVVGYGRSIVSIESRLSRIEGIVVGHDILKSDKPV